MPEPPSKSDPPDSALLDKDSSGTAPRGRPFPDSLCHRCAAPPRYIETRTSTFILCPILPNKYPRQPVLSCSAFRQR